MILSVSSIFRAINSLMPERRLLGSFLFTFVCIFALSGVVVYVGYNLQSITNSIVHTGNVIKQVERVEFQMKDLESMNWGYIATGDKAFLTSPELLTMISNSLSSLERLVDKDSSLREKVGQLRAKVETRLKFAERTLEIANTLGPIPALKRMKERVGLKLNEEIREISQSIIKEQETKLEEERIERDKKMEQLLALILIGIVGIFVILFYSYVRLRAQIQNLSLADQKKLRAVNSLQNIVDTVRDPLLILEGDLTVISAGRSFYETFNLSQDQTEKKFIYELGEREWDIPEFRKLLGEVLSKKDELSDFEVTNIFPQMGQKTWLVSARRMSSGIPGLPRILVSLKDITERTSAENRVKRANLELNILKGELEERVENRTQELLKSEGFLKLAVRAAKLGLFDHDIVNDKIYWTDEMQTICGFLPKAPLSLPEFLKRIHQDDREKVAKAIFDCFDPEGNGFYSMEHRIVFSDGTVHWASMKAQAYFAGEGKERRAVRSVGVILDITDRKRAEGLIQQALESLAREKAKLEESNKGLERFASIAAHDLRAPIRSMGLWVDMLEQYMPKPLPSELENAIQFLKLNAVKSAALIEDLLEVAKVKYSDIIVETVDLNKMVQQVLWTLKPDLENTKAQLKIGKLPSIEGNPCQLESVFGNLLRNALTYRDKTRAVEISIDCNETEQGYEFAVKDNGIGIDPEFKDRIFEMFERLHTDDDYPGTGIGLALCKNIVEGWGGKIGVTSVLGKGSSIFFNYPKKAINLERKSA